MTSQSSEHTPSSSILILPLQEWLKLLSSRGVDMRVSMALAAKIHNTRERLSQLDAKKLTLIVPDKDQRKSVLNAVKGIASGQTFNKKRTRDSDLLEPLRPDAEEPLPQSLEFHEVLDPEILIPLTMTVNRAPVKTAWAYVVATRLGFDVQEALSIAHVHVHISSMKHALMLGNILNKEETREAEAEIRELPGDEKWLKKDREREGGRMDWRKGKGKGRRGEKEEVKSIGSSQPWVGIMRARPVIERPDGSWRAIEKGIPVPPSLAYLYITRAFKDYTPHLMGALRLLAESYTPDELNRLGQHMYNEFKPDVVEWGQRGILECAKILDQLKAPLPDEVEAMAGQEVERESPISTGPEAPVQANGEKGTDGLTDAGSVLSELPDIADEATPSKRQKELTLEEYEAMLDAENAPGGFLEGGDIPGARHHDA